MARRSYLFVPGNRPDRLAKAWQSGADAIILDLEDAVAGTQKDQAREAVVLLDRRPCQSNCIQSLVRVEQSGRSVPYSKQAFRRVTGIEQEEGSTHEQSWEEAARRSNGDFTRTGGCRPLCD